MDDDKQMLYGRCRIIKDWLYWDYSIHSEESQIARQGRAFTYPFEFELHETSKSAKFSSTSELPYYKTTLSNCTCFDVFL